MNLEAENQILNYCCPAWPNYQNSPKRRIHFPKCGLLTNCIQNWGFWYQRFYYSKRNHFLRSLLHDITLFLINVSQMNEKFLMVKLLSITIKESLTACIHFSTPGRCSMLNYSAKLCANSVVPSFCKAGQLQQHLRSFKQYLGRL